MPRQRNYSEEWARRKGRKAAPWSHRVAHIESREPTPEAIAERNDAYGFYRDPVADLMGDPPIGRSALFRKRLGV